MRYPLLVAAAAAALFSVPSQAAMLGSLHGDVHVNDGAGFQKLTGESLAVAPGSRIMVGPGGSAMITYSDNCAVRVPSGVWAVQEAAPCPQGVAMLDFTKRMNQEAPPPETDESGIGTTTLLLGGLVVAGGVGAAVLLLDNDSGKGGYIPVSP